MKNRYNGLLIILGMSAQNILSLGEVAEVPQLERRQTRPRHEESEESRAVQREGLTQQPRSEVSERNPFESKKVVFHRTSIGRGEAPMPIRSVSEPVPGQPNMHIEATPVTSPSGTPLASPRPASPLTPLPALEEPITTPHAIYEGPGRERAGVVTQRPTPVKPSVTSAVLVHGTPTEVRASRNVAAGASKLENAPKPLVKHRVMEPLPNIVKKEGTAGTGNPHIQAPAVARRERILRETGVKTGPQHPHQ